jgi:hypothetical protein
MSAQRHIPTALYTWAKDLRYSLDRTLGGPPEPVWTQARGNILSPLPGIEAGSVRSQTILTELPRLLCEISPQIIVWNGWYQ